MSSSLAILVLIALVAAGAFSLRRADAQQLSGDAQVVAQLRQAGSDLGKPHTVEFFMYFPAEASAKHVAERLKNMGFKAEVKPAAQGALPWLTFATRSMVVEVAELERLRQVLTGLSAAEHGEYDGWGTSIVK